MDLKIKLTIELDIVGRDTNLIAAEKAIADFFSDVKYDMYSGKSACGNFTIVKVAQTDVKYES